MDNMPKVNKKGDSRKDFPKGSTPNGQKPATNKFGDTQEPNREGTPQGEKPQTHKTGE